MENYRNLGVETKLMDVAEKVASEYANTAYLSVGVHNVEALNMYFKRGYIPDRSGAWYKNAIYSPSLDRKKGNESTVFRNYENDLEFFLYKKLELTDIYKFPVTNTPERPYLRWWEDRIKAADGRINNEKYQKIRVGDIVFLADTQTNDFLRCKVIFRHEYDTYEEMLQFEGVKNMLPFLDYNDIKKGVDIYQAIPGMSAKCVKKYGCVAFGFEVIGSRAQFGLLKK